MHLSGLTATVGLDRQIYCKSCHLSVFQQQGYQIADVTAVKGEPGDTNTCIKVCNNKLKGKQELLKLLL